MYNLAPDWPRSARRMASSRQTLRIKLGISVQTVKNWETGRRSMSTDRLAQIAAIFKMTVDVLVKPNGSPIPGGSG